LQSSIFISGDYLNFLSQINFSLEKSFWKEEKMVLRAFGQVLSQIAGEVIFTS